MSAMQAILFDCDGVLVDTERDCHRVAFNQAFAAMGLNVVWSVEHYADLLEITGGKERMRHHFDQAGWPDIADRDAFIRDAHELKTSKFMEIIELGEMSLRPGVEALIRSSLDAGLTVAVCSTSNERAVQGIVDQLIGKDIAPQITVFAGDMVPAKKPDPAIYLLAANTLGLDPAKCMVIEDSNIGLRAAKAAGMYCTITKSSYTSGEDFSIADKVVDDLSSGGVSLQTCRLFF